MNYFAQPPFLVCLIGVAIALACSSSFKAQVEQELRKRDRDAKDIDFYQLAGTGIYVAYWGACLGVWVFLGGGLSIFGFGKISAYGVAALLALFTGSLIWNQLNELLVEFQEGGSKALDLDEMNR